jgi:hypothetical protein
VQFHKFAGQGLNKVKLDTLRPVDYGGGGEHTNPNYRDTLNNPIEEVKPNMNHLSSRMLKNTEIKEICRKLHLSRKDVYEIRSKYISMCLMSDSCTMVAQEAARPTQSYKMSTNQHG